MITSRIFCLTSLNSFKKITLFVGLIMVRIGITHICTGLVVISMLLLVTNYIQREDQRAQNCPNEVQLLFSYSDLDTLLCREELKWNLTRLPPESYENCPKKGITSVLFIKGRTGKILSVIIL